MTPPATATATAETTDHHGGSTAPLVVVAGTDTLPAGHPFGPDALTLPPGALLPDALDGVDPARPVLVLPADVTPDAGWTAPLLAAAATGIVGIRVVAADGTLVHAGARTDGAPAMAGDPDGHGPLVTHDRLAVPLLPPFAGPAGRLRAAATDPAPARPVVIGRYRGDLHAVTPQAPIVPAPPRPALADRYRDAVLVALPLAPHWLAAPHRALLHDLAERLQREGRALVVCWSDASPHADRAPSATLERAGALLVGGRATEDRWVPPARAVAAALRPAAILVLDEDTATDELGPLGVAWPPAVRVDLSAAPTGTSDVTAADLGPDAAAAIARLRPSTPAPPRIPPIDVRERTDVTSIVIPVWNRWDLTEACLAAIAEHTPEPHEIVVVDNASTDETPARLAERPEVRTITNATNLGFAAGSNVGLRAATGRHLVLLNNDTEVGPGWLRELLDVAADPGVGLVGPRSNSISGLQVVPGAPELADPDAARRFAREWHHLRRGLSWPLERLVGFCLLGRAEVWEQLGALDEGVGIGNFEDDELCLRARAAGYTLRVADGSVVLHHGSATFDSANVDATAAALTGARHVFDRHATHAELATVVVLGDGDPATVAATLQDAWHVADGALVIERRAVDSVDLGARIGLRGAKVMSADWTAPGALGRLLGGLASRHAIVLGAGEQLVVRDHALARVELLARSGRPLGLDTPSGPRIRVVPPDRGDLVEHHAHDVLRSMVVRPYGSGA